jgi:hypothetical protein
LFLNREARLAYVELAKAIEKAPVIPPCQQTDPELWFQEHGTSSYRIARALCNRCPVRAQCLEYAVKNQEEFGMWGGMSPYERRLLKRSSPK